jgi:hypothetical protein
MEVLMRFAVAALLVVTLAACSETHHYYPAPETPQEAPQGPATPTPAPEPTPPIATPPTPPHGTKYQQYWFGTVPYQIAQSIGACRVTVTAPTSVTTNVALHDCQPGTTARVVIGTPAGSIGKTISANDPLLYVLHADISTAVVHSMLRDGAQYPHDAPMILQGELRWHKMLRNEENP